MESNWIPINSQGLPFLFAGFEFDAHRKDCGELYTMKISSLDLFMQQGYAESLHESEHFTAFTKLKRINGIWNYDNSFIPMYGNVKYKSLTPLIWN